VLVPAAPLAVTLPVAPAAPAGPAPPVSPATLVSLLLLLPLNQSAQCTFDGFPTIKISVPQQCDQSQPDGFSIHAIETIGSCRNSARFLVGSGAGMSIYSAKLPNTKVIGCLFAEMVAAILSLERRDLIF
jgi:hypothetical protein